MKPMKRLTDKKTALRLISQSLPITLAAIVLVIYGSTFLPFTTPGMERCAALVEKASYYQISSGGKPSVWFKSLGEGCTLDGLSLEAGPAVTTKTYATGCWVNEYPIFPSCPGLLLTTNNDSAAEKAVAGANKDIRAVVRNEAGRLAAAIRRLEQKEEEADYYMRVHNVNDDGYNVMAAYAEDIRRRKDKAGRLAGALKALADNKDMKMTLVTSYTLLYYNDTAKQITRTPCRILTQTRTAPLRLLQTSSRRKPDGATAVYLHQWLTPSPAAGDGILTVAIPGCSQYGFAPGQAKAKAFSGHADGDSGHGTPETLAPDGSAVFTAGGMYAGLSIGGKIVKTNRTGFGLKNLRR